MVAGAPFPDLLDWTWGELAEFIECRYEAKRSELRDQAAMSFQSALTFLKMFGAKKGTKFKVTDEYSFLWSQEEHQQMEIEEFERKMMAQVRKKDKPKINN